MDEIAKLSQDIAELKSIMVSRLPQTRTQSVGREIIDIDEVIRITKKARPTIYRLVQHGQMPGYKKGKKWYFFRDEIEDWIASGSNRLYSIPVMEAKIRQTRSSQRLR